MEKRRMIALGVGAGLVLGIIFVAFVVGVPLGKASVKSVWAPPSSSPGEMVTLCAMVENNQPFKVPYMVEVGVIPDSIAQRWFPGALSIFGIGSPGECCKGQMNIEDRFIKLDPYESRKVCMQVNVPFEGIQDRCGSIEYWKGADASYTSYFQISNHCNYRQGQKIEGYELYNFKLMNMEID